ncbi:MAG: signal recognition particle protein [Bacillota bacterium]|nr:signal recognition particle protein [Bacillota bacterium]
MFENLTARLQGIFSGLRQRGKLTEEDVKKALREVRMALLEADVHFQVARDLVQKIQERAVGQEVMESLTPGQQVVKIVRDELQAALGSSAGARLKARKGLDPLVILLFGLQGVGKTTTAGKLALHLKKSGQRVLLVAADLQRPAAVEQLKILGKKEDIPVFFLEGKKAPEVARLGVEEGRRRGFDAVLVDTAGRLHMDEELMVELEEVARLTHPDESLLVVDAMAGQDALKSATAFAERLPLTGFILTKMDGDARGGVALSLRAVTEKPIKFVGTGEDLAALEPFRPERMAGRILGMGDVLTLIEKAEETLDREKAAEWEKRLKEADFTLEDFLDQMREMKKLGPLDQLVRMIPGFSGAMPKVDKEAGEKELKRLEAMILSMTPYERRRPQIIDGSRKRRIARGAGVEVHHVNQLLRQFDEMRRLMRTLSKGGAKGRKRGRMGLF